jgi:hypothetical protein
MKAHQNVANNILHFCDSCSYSHAVKSNLTVHMMTHMSRESRPNYYCAYCPQIFTRLSMKTNHERKMHTNPGQEFSCDCGKKFKSYHGLYYHRKNEHSSTEFPCENCTEVFPSKIKLKLHFFKNHKPKTACEVCGKLTPSISKHMKLEHSGRIKCTFEGCGKDFASRSSLSSHIGYAHRQQDGLKCETCDAEFNSEYRLKIHILRQHRTEKKPCRVQGCTHSTSRTAYLVMHIKNHRDLDSKEKAKLIAELKNK